MYTMELIPCFWIVVSVNLLLVVERYSIADSCTFEYTQQPPSCLSCNPYNNETSPPQLNLTLACGAQRTDDKSNQWTFDLRWFSNYSSKSLAHITDVRTQPFNNMSVLVTSPGQYWCQVLDYTDGPPSHLLGRSNVAEILSWEWYSSLPMCKGVQSVMESKCADLIPSPSPISNPPTCFMSKTKVQTHAVTESSSSLLPSTSIQHKESSSPLSPSTSIKHKESSSPLSPATSIKHKEALSPIPSSILIKHKETSSPLSPSTSIQHKHTSSQANGVPSVSANTVSEEGCTCGITDVLVVVIVAMLATLLLLMVGIVVALFLWQSYKSRTKAKESPMIEQGTSRHYEKRKQKGCDETSQTVKSEQIIPLELSTSPETETTTKSHEFSSVQLVKLTTSFSMKTVHPPLLKESSTKASCDATANSACEWESQYLEADPTSKEHSPKSEACRKKSKIP